MTKRSYFRACVEDTDPYVPGEQPPPDARGPGGAKVIKLNTNENPYPPSPRVIEAVRRAADEALRFYPDPLALELRAAASSALGFELDWIIAVNGSDELLAMLVRSVVETGGKVAYPVPTYSLYPTLVRAHGAQAVEVPWAEGYCVPQGLAGSGAGLTFLARPNAPTGTCVPLDELRDLAGSLRAQDYPSRASGSFNTSNGGGVLCIDEAYCDFADDDALDLVREFENVIVARTLSKSHSLAGLRVGFGIAQPELLLGLWKTKDSYNLDRVAISAGAAALSDVDWMKRNADRIRRTRERMTGELKGLGLDCVPSQANFVLARAGHGRARDLYERLKERGILVRYFDQEAVRDCLRITVGTDEEVDALLEALKELVGA